MVCSQDIQTKAALSSPRGRFLSVLSIKQGRDIKILSGNLFNVFKRNKYELLKYCALKISLSPRVGR